MTRSLRTMLTAGAAERKAYFVIFYAYFAFGILLQVFPPLLNDVMRDFGLSRQAAALVMTLFMAPLVVLAIPAGLLVDRLGVVGPGRVAFVLMILGALITVLAGSFSVLLIGRIVSGAGGALLLITLLKIIARTFRREQYGLALGVFAAGLPAGTGLAFNLLPPLGHALGWRPAVLAAVLVAGSAAVIFERLVGHRGPETDAPAVSPARALHSGEVWRLALTTALGYMAILGFTTWTPTVLIGYAGIPLWVGALIASLLLVIDIPFAPLWGALSDRVGRRKPFIVTGFSVYLIGSLAVPFIAVTPGLAIPGLTAVIAFMAIGCAMFFPTALAIAGEAVAPELAGASYGLFLTAQVFGMMLGPMLVGAVLDHGSVPQSFLAVSVMTLAGLVAALTLHTR